MNDQSKAFLRYVAAQPKGRVGYDILEYDRVHALAREAIEAGYVEHRRFFFGSGFQVTKAGRSYVAGEAL